MVKELSCGVTPDEAMGNVAFIPETLRGGWINLLVSYDSIVKYPSKISHTINQIIYKHNV